MYYVIKFATKVSGVYQGNPWTGLRVVAVRYNSNSNDAAGIEIFKAPTDLDISRLLIDVPVACYFDSFGRLAEIQTLEN